ncbi:carboxylate-amine ligase [Streptomyces cacaoi]|uniref:Putative glutamate--cysteine ligase 2 n=2 Tax=Streptomyces cacaoi TaxID=1898 RepID=A0A4Y3R4I7_STRCI|nr:YbdK family carboxylate-amine ligase [Streptomyces cacaoi]NNG88156.1 YbdK family carboxylate-amine ligase [Streptomyces cacaoi]GEB52555.1 putative glutamate--cysteine ligase 2 [Streptomyces cacaoi]
MRAQRAAAGPTTADGTPFTLGVEEEFLLAGSDEVPAVRPGADVLLAGGGTHTSEDPTVLHGELLTSMAETATGVCTDLGQVHEQLSSARARLRAAAGEAGIRPLPLGTPRVAGPPRSASPGPHYGRMRRLYGHLVTQSETCGCHVHVGTFDREAAVWAAGYVRPWLPTLLALSANSPFYKGVDTGYASWRTVMLSRWPTLEIPPHFSSADAYDRAVTALQRGGVLPRGCNAYWLVRPSYRLPTVELRVADTAATVDEAVLQAGLSRALVHTALAARADGEHPPQVDGHMASAALWTAARHGVRGPALHPFTGRQVPAADLVSELMALLRPALRAAGDLDTVQRLLARVLRDGTGADRQRATERYGTPDPATTAPASPRTTHPAATPSPS